MESADDNQCTYVFCNGKRKGMRCEKPKSTKDCSSCYCSFHYHPYNRSKKSLEITIPSDNETELIRVSGSLEEPVKHKKKLQVVLPKKDSVISQLSPKTLERFKERFEIEQARMLEDKLYREYKKHRILNEY